MVRVGFWSALEEVYGETEHQRCWMHKSGNVLNYFPKSMHDKVNEGLHNIWRSPTRSDAKKSFDLFIKMYGSKYPKATDCLQKDRSALLAFYNYPAKHWQSIRTNNVIESTFGTIRHRTKRSKGTLTRTGMLNMMFKLSECAEKKWRKLRGFRDLAKVVIGIQFKDGVEQNIDQEAA